MSKDRYSSDHTIQIVDGGTLTVDGDLDITGALTVPNITVSNDLIVNSDIFAVDDVVVGDDLVVGDDANVGGTLTAATLSSDNYNFTTTKQFMRWIPLSVISHAIIAGCTSGIDTPADTSTGGATDGSNTISDYPTVILGHATLPTWHIFIAVDPFIPNGASIDEVVFVVENFLSSDEGESVDYQVDVESFNQTGFGSTFTNLGSDTASVSLLENIRTLLRFTVDTDIINQTLLTGDCIRIKFAQTDSTQANIISIFKMGLLLSIDDLDQGLGIDLSL